MILWKVLLVFYVKNGSTAVCDTNVRKFEKFVSNLGNKLLMLIMFK